MFDQLDIISKDITLVDVFTNVYGLVACQLDYVIPISKFIFGYAWCPVVSQYVLLECYDTIQKLLHTPK